jgi:small ubiquitin-related modifier
MSDDINEEPENIVVPFQEPSINVKVVGNDGSELHFKIKKNTILKKLMEAYYKRQGLQDGTLRFTFDGNRIIADRTAGQVGLEDGDTIDVMSEQTGGY